MAALRRPTKNEKRRSKKKDGTENCALSSSSSQQQETKNGHTASSINDILDDIEVEYVSADYAEDIGLDTSMLEQFRSVFEKFAKPEELVSENNQAVSNQIDEGSAQDPDAVEQKDIEEGTDSQKLSKRKKKLMTRLSVAELKQLVQRPDVVEAHDVTSSDPRLLVTLKSYRNSVPVPRHWCHIRKYLTGKVGMEKPPFQLPEFIAETGIAKIRDAVMEQEAAKKSKAKARERIRPKMGKIDIDYQVLHDAFFKYQTKPKLTGHGDLYYEGKEYEVSMKEMKPGQMSKELTNALGILDGAPPPWLINMQRYGPPPSYPSMKIPGLSAPLPPGAQYGYQPGGWGKPPVDEYGRPLYGDVFGQAEESYEAAEVVDKEARWGALAAVEYEDDEEEGSEGSEAGDDEGEEDGHGRAYDPSGAETPSTLDGSIAGSAISGLETPDTVDLRKRAGMETPDSTYTSVAGGRELYHVIQERANEGAAAVGQMFGSDRVYVLPNGTTNHGNGSAENVEEEVSEESNAAGKKRKIDSSASAAKRMKEFKF